MFIRLGYRNVKHTGSHASTDGGVDVWMLNAEGNVEIVQCKQLRSRVDRNDLIYFGKVMRQQHAVRGHFWAPTGFTQPAIDYATVNNIELYEDPRIRKLVEKVFFPELERAKLQESNKAASPPVISQPSQSQIKPRKVKPYFGMSGGQFSVVIILLSFAIILGTCLLPPIIESLFNR